MPMSTSVLSLKVHSVDKETLETILDRLEAGQFCNCLTDKNAGEVRLYKELSHYKNCIGNVIVSEIIYEDKHGDA